MSYQVPAKSDYYYDESTNPIEEICKYTDNLEWILPELRYQMLAEICRQKGSSVYGHYDAPPNKHIVAQINGERGYFLKKTTAAANIYLIWYHPSKDRYMFWGPTERSVRDAMNRIRGRIVKCVDEMDYVDPAPKEPQAEQDFGTDKAIEIMMKHNPGMNEEQAKNKLNEMVASVVVDYY